MCLAPCWNTWWPRAGNFSEAIASDHMPRLEKLRSRMRWLDDTAGMTLLGKDIKELSALIQRTSARAKVSLGLKFD